MLFRSELLEALRIAALQATAPATLPGIGDGATPVAEVLPA